MVFRKTDNNKVNGFVAAAGLLSCFFISSFNAKTDQDIICLIEHIKTLEAQHIKMITEMTSMRQLMESTITKHNEQHQATKGSFDSLKLEADQTMRRVDGVALSLGRLTARMNRVEKKSESP